MDEQGQIKAKRDAAARARRLAAGLNERDPARPQMLAFADALDAEADALVRQLRNPPPPPVTQIQMQVQQQENPEEPEDEKEK